MNVASKADANTFTLTSPVSKTASGDVIIDLVETATTRLASGTNTIVGVDAGALGKTSQGLTALGWQAGRSNEGSDKTVSVQVTSVVRASDTSFQVKWVESAFERGDRKSTRLNSSH